MSTNNEPNHNSSPMDPEKHPALRITTLAKVKTAFRRASQRAKVTPEDEIEDPQLPTVPQPQHKKEPPKDGRPNNRFYRTLTSYTHPWRTWWFMWISILTLYNMTWVPFRCCFFTSVEDNKLWMLILDTIIDTFFWVDIFFNFNMPFQQGGQIIYHPKEMAKRYLKRWFIPELIMSFPLHLLPGLIVSRAIQPLWRLNTLLRAVRLPFYFNSLERLSINVSFVRLMKFLLLIFLTAHWLGCGWFLVIWHEGPISAQWTGLPELNLPETSPWFKYVQALYWSFVTMTGYGGDFPITDAEIIYSLFTVIVGIAVYVTMIGTVGSLVTNLDSSASMFRQKMDSINDYMKYRRLPPSLQDQVKSYYNYLWKSRKGLDENKVLADLPAYLRMEVAMHLNKDIIELVPLFKNVDRNFIAAVVMNLKPRVCLPNALVVRKGEIGREMFFIRRGFVEISNDAGKVVAKLYEGSFFGESALLFDTKRNANVRAGTYCDLFVLTKEDFDEVRSEYPEHSKKIEEIAIKRAKENKEKEEAEAAAARAREEQARLEKERLEQEQAQLGNDEDDDEDDDTEDDSDYEDDDDDEDEAAPMPTPTTPAQQLQQPQQQRRASLAPNPEGVNNANGFTPPPLTKSGSNNSNNSN